MISVYQAAQEVERVAEKLQRMTIGKREALFLCHIIQDLIAQIRDLEMRSRQEQSYRAAYGAMVEDWNGWVSLMRSNGLFVSSTMHGSWEWEIVQHGLVCYAGKADSITDAHRQALRYMLKENYLDLSK